jgi:hypothetical protein
MGGGQSKEERRRNAALDAAYLDVRAETSLFAARPAFLWAFQISKKQLRAVFSQRTSLSSATAAQGHAFGLQCEVKQRQSLLA